MRLLKTGLLPAAIIFGSIGCGDGDDAAGAGGEGGGQAGSAAGEGGSGGEPGVDWGEYEGDTVESITAIIHTNVVVKDIERSLAFYRDLLGGNVFVGGSGESEGAGAALGTGGVVKWEGHLISFGTTPMFIDLLEYLSPETEGEPYDSANHLGITRLRFGVSDFDETYRELESAGVTFISGPGELELFGRKVRGCLLRDPDGTLLELVQADESPPEDSGLTLVDGINHIVVVVSDLDSSVKYYTSMLGGKAGLRGSGESEAAGEMLALEGTVKWREQLVQFAATNTLVHLIEYETPVSTEPPYRKLNNAGIARICFNVTGVDQTFRDMEEAGVEFMSEPQDINLLGLPVRACMFEDPDGAMLELVEAEGL